MARRAKRHHVVPRFYLRRWADERDRVFLVDRAAGLEREVSTGAALVRKDFYTLEAEDGTRSDAFETVLSDIEGKAASVFRAIDAGTWPLDDDQRGVMANFIALQMTRTPKLREISDEALTQMNNRMTRLLLSDDAAFEAMIQEVVGPDATDADRARYRAALAEPAEVRITGAGLMEAMVEGIDEVLQPIHDMHWTLVTAVDSEFLTSDVPVFHWRPAKWPDHLPVGLLTADKTHIPLSRTQILVIAPRSDASPDPDDQMQMLAPGVSIVNATAAVAAHRSFLFHPSMASRLEKLFRVPHRPNTS